MATSARPGVEITQVVTAESPTVLTPTLIPCIVGPCFQIVEALTTEGALNSSAVVTTAARLLGDGIVADPIPGISGTTMTITVNGVDKPVTFPVSIGGAAISQAVILNTLNTALGSANATASFVDDTLVVLTAAKGTSATLQLKTNAAGDPLNISSKVGVLISGRGNYDNLSYDIPYSSLPSPLVTDMDDLVLESDNLRMFRYFNRTLSEYSKDSAPNWNAYTGGATQVHNISRTVISQPAFSNPKTYLHGIKSTGSKTNKLMHLGQEATITIPLAHGTGNGVVKWPDSTGANYLKVTALGYQNYKTSPSNAVGDYVGDSGNDIVISFTNGGGHTAAWNAGLSTLTIDKDLTTTFAQLATAIASVANASTALVLELVYDSALAASPCFDDLTIPWGVGQTRTYYLAGGMDPIDFSADAAGSAQSAGVVGSVNILAAKTNTAFGIAGKTLDISLNGADWITTTFVGANTPDADLTTALGADATVSTVAVSNEEGVVITCLSIVTTTTNSHDSTIEMKSDDASVIETLFSGFKTKTEAVAGAILDANAWGGGGIPSRRLVLEETDYNVDAIGFNTQAIVPGSLTLELGDMAINGHIVFDFTDAMVAAMDTAAGGAGQDLTVVWDVGGAATSQLINVGGATVTVSGMVAAIDAAIGGGALNNLVAVSQLTTGQMVLSDTGGANNLSVSVMGGADIHMDALLTSQAAYGDALNAGLQGTTVSSATTSMTIKDDGTANALRVTTVGNNVANALYGATFAAAFDATDATDLTALFLDPLASFSYSIGESTAAAAASGAVLFLGDSVQALATDKETISATIVAATTLTVTYSRAWACEASAGAHAYAGRVFHGRSDKVEVGDKLWNNGAVVGIVNSIDALALGGAFTGAQLTISEFAVDNSTDLTQWYITAENLPTTGRIDPEYVGSDTTQVASLKHALLRDSAGIALSGSAQVYTQYDALRKDVTAASADPQLLSFNTVSEVESSIGPVSTANPLAFALSKAFEATTNISISAMGISATSADALSGTPAAYAEALDFLEKKEVYAMVPLSLDREVHKLFDTHVTNMSAPASKKERISLVCQALPTEKEATIAISGEMTVASIGGGKYEFTFTDGTLNTITALNGLLDANGTAIIAGVGVTLTTDQGVYIDRSGDPYKYIVTKIVSATTLQVDTTNIFAPGSGPGTGGNDDSYYVTGTTATTELDAYPATGESCSTAIRQAAVDKTTTTGRDSLALAMAEITGGVSGYQNRRLVWMQPEAYNVSVNGTTTKVDGYYHCATVAALLGQNNPSQPYTNYPIAGYLAPVGSNDLFTETQMATAAAGGVWWAIQDTPGGAVASRHQLTTDMTNLKTKETSIVTAVDYVAKLIRNQVSRFIGRNNITRQLLEAVSLGISGALASVEGSVVAKASLDAITQDADNLDTIKVDVTLVPFYPANHIKITIYV
jgi:hypothetical protein